MTAPTPSSSGWTSTWTKSRVGGWVGGCCRGSTAGVGAAGVVLQGRRCCGRYCNARPAIKLLAALPVLPHACPAARLPDRFALSPPPTPTPPPPAPHCTALQRTTFGWGSPTTSSCDPRPSGPHPSGAQRSAPQRSAAYRSGWVVGATHHAAPPSALPALSAPLAPVPGPCRHPTHLQPPPRPLPRPLQARRLPLLLHRAPQDEEHHRQVQPKGGPHRPV